MAVTGAIFKSLIFDDIDSRNYGVYITGEAVYNAPAREVEMITIAGRNGQLALDKGRFENIEVTYPAGIFADNQADYAKAISDFRNALCSKVGYQRLTDEYNVDEYRMAVYKSGLEVSSVNSAGEFQITFDCQPQRFLMSGEAPITVSSGDMILNPTHFESKPMLEVEGYGTIGFNGFEIEIANAVMGNLVLDDDGSSLATFSSAVLNVGDTITIHPSRVNLFIYPSEGAYEMTSVEVLSSSGDLGCTYEITSERSHKVIKVAIPEQSFTYENTRPFFDVTETLAVRMTATNRYDSSIIVTEEVNCYIEIKAAKTNFPKDVHIELIVESDDTTFKIYHYDKGLGQVTADSTVSILGHPTYIDCDLGEAYLIRDNTPISLNRYIDLGSKLPTFAVGSNEITFDNTITDLKVVPRWWQV